MEWDKHRAVIADVSCGRQGAEWSRLHRACESMAPEATRWREAKPGCSDQTDLLCHSPAEPGTEWPLSHSEPVSLTVDEESSLSHEDVQ